MEGGGGDEVYPWLRKMRIRKGKMTERERRTEGGKGKQQTEKRQKKTGPAGPV